MNLQTLLQPLIPYQIQGNHEFGDIDISSIEMDSRMVSKDSLFICVVGSSFDGHKFASIAVEQGAAAIVSEIPLEVDVPVIIVPDSRRAMSVLADRFYHSPTSKLRLIGVTGTNGKTTMTHIIEQLLEDQGKRTGRIGTINSKIGEEVVDSGMTTPESIDLQKAFSRMVEVGSEYAVIEASSHAIHIGRIRGCNFRTVVFTNLTQDHLDYHGTMEEYKRAKGLIFAHLGNRYDGGNAHFAILNADDEAHHYYQQITPAQVITYGIDNHKADIWAKNIQITSQGTTFSVESFKGTETFQLKMLGKFNVYNVLGAIGVGLVEGFTLSQMKATLEDVKGVRGRMEPVDAGQEFAVIVDYAHTPDSLENVLHTIQGFNTEKGKVYCIIGCGGDRDRTKRPIMAQIAIKYADISIFTSDNPRSEDPNQIIEDMVNGLIEEETSHTKYKTIIDRREAIKWTLHQAKPGDIVLIAGKGHETTQKVKDKVFTFDDKQVALDILSNPV
jgi:UDP-N-acetylmuramoyl-L-alanyl-D-glutamate--2,6-diaminopimelate ligase